jgi:chromosome segregation ATPase
MTAARVSPSVALAAYAEAWISGAKVVVFGDALSPLAERLVERGARHVQVYDVDAVRAREAAAASSSKHIAHAPLELAGSALRDGAFDVGIVENLASAGQNPKGLLTTLARSLSRRGLALIGSRNPDVPARLIRGAVEAEQPLGYYDFYDTVSQHFDEVRMLGQTPFVGYAIADFSAADANDVRIDTALLPSGAEEPEWFLALGSALPVSPDAFSVIQLPIAEVDLGTIAERAEVEPESIERVENAEARIRELEAALAELAAEGAREAEKHAAERARDAEAHAAERARDAEKHAAERIREAEKHAAERAREAEKQAAAKRRGGEEEVEKGLAQKLQALQAELEKREEWLAGLESRAATADERADQAQAKLEQATKEQRKAKEQITRLEQQLEDERRSKRQLEDQARAHEQDNAKRERRLESEAQRAAELASESKALAARVAELTAALAKSERAAKQRAEDGDEEARAELLQLEALLKDRAAEVGRLTEALHETERFGRQLIIKLGEVEASRADAPQSPDLQGLTRRNAELAADLEAARWTISSLEANVGAPPTASASAGVNQRRDDMTPAEPAPGADG